MATSVPCCVIMLGEEEEEEVEEAEERVGEVVEVYAV